MKYTSAYLWQCSLFDLRIIGQDIGVRAPTALTKKVLIQSILDVSSGKVPPHSSNRGRPQISIHNDKEIKIVNAHLPLSTLESLRLYYQQQLKDLGLDKLLSDFTDKIFEKIKKAIVDNSIE